MGLNIFSSSSCASSGPVVGNPNPARFVIVRASQVGRLTAVEVRYLDATTYEGRKLMVYRASEAELRNAARLDPHFCENEHLAPIARFRPTEAGWSMAMELINKHGTEP